VNENLIDVVFSKFLMSSFAGEEVQFRGRNHLISFISMFTGQFRTDMMTMMTTMMITNLKYSRQYTYITVYNRRDTCKLVY